MSSETRLLAMLLIAIARLVAGAYTDPYDNEWARSVVDGMRDLVSERCGDE